MTTTTTTGEGGEDSTTATTNKEQIEEYERQLNEINELLKATPNDESLLSLKNDLVELLELTRSSYLEDKVKKQSEKEELSQEQQQEEQHEEPSSVIIPPPPPPPPQQDNNISTDNNKTSPAVGEMEIPPPPPQSSLLSKTDESTAQQQIVGNDDEALPTATTKKKKKTSSKTKIKDFEIPSHLIPLASDTDGEKNRKRRAIKALKNKWREKKKDIESTNKQQSWQSFASKKKRKGMNDTSRGGSIFATQDNYNSKVGVISSNKKTDFNERKRHKY